MKSLLLMSLTLISLLLAIGCSDEVANNEFFVTEGYTDGRVDGTVHGIVYDGADNARLSGVAVYAIVDGVVTRSTTNAEGYYVFSNLESGDYAFTFKAPPGDRAYSYAMSELQVTIPDITDFDMEDIPHSQDIPWSSREDISLYPLSARLSGQVFRRTDDENALPAAGVTVIADFPGFGISVNEFTAVTTATGDYSFDALPATGTTHLRSVPFSDGTNNFGEAAVVAPLTPGALSFADPMVALRSGIDPIIQSNNFAYGGFPVDGSPEFVFSTPMNAARTEIGLLNGLNPVPATITWDGDTGVTIDPVPALLTGTTYTIDIDAETVDGVPYAAALTFATVPAISLVATNLETADGLYLDYPHDQDITLEFSAVPDLAHLDGYFELTRDGGATEVYVSVSLNGSTVTLAPPGGLTPGTSYALDYLVHSPILGDFTTAIIDFTTARSLAPPPLVQGFMLSNPGLAYDYDDDAFSFDWNFLDDVDGFEIFAQNDADRSDFVRVGSFAAGSVTGGVSLPAGIFGAAPLSHGVSVSFRIVAYNDAGYGPLSGTVSVEDTVVPVLDTLFGIGGVLQIGTADNNPGANTVTMTVEFRTTEPLDPGEVPDISVANGGGTNPYVLPESAIEYSYLPMGILLTITIVPNADGSGDTLIISDMADTSGISMQAVSIILD